MNKLKNKYLDLLMMYLISKIILIIIFYISQKSIGWQFIWEKIYYVYDAEHYLNIANTGYTENLLYAFFPLYPLLIKLLSPILSDVIAGILISNLCQIGIGVLILKMVDSDKVKKPLLLLFFGINNLFFSIIYTESLYVFLTLLAYYLYKNKKFFIAGLCLGLSVCTRNTGALLFFALFIEMLFNKEKFMNIIKMYIPATMLSLCYPIYLYITTGNLFKFVSVQSESWGMKLTAPGLNVLADSINMFNPSVIPFIKYVSFTSIIALIYSIHLLYNNIRKKEYMAMNIYIILTLLTVLTSFKSIPLLKYNCNTAATTSMFRYIFGLFPIYLYSVKDTKLNNILVKYIFPLVGVSIIYFNLIDIFIA